MIDVRRLTPSEISAIRVGLRMLREATALEPLLIDARIAEDVLDTRLLTDGDIEQLIQTLRVVDGVALLPRSLERDLESIRDGDFER